MAHRTSDAARPRRGRRNQRGVVFPSPVVILSIVAVAMAGVAFLTTRGDSSGEAKVATASSQQTMTPSPTASRTARGARSASASPTAASTSARPTRSAAPVVDRATTPVVVFNNSRVTGLAAQVAAKAKQIGWQVVGADNWYGTIPATTVYYPNSMKPAAQKLALDLGIARTAPAVDPMRNDRLTVILTGPLS